MTNKRIIPSKSEFVCAVQESFAFLLERGFKQEPISLSERDIFVAFSNDYVRLVIEGTDWGLNTRVAFGHATPLPSFENYDLDDLIQQAGVRVATKPRRGSIAKGSSQLDQIRFYAEMIREQFPTLLSGDRSLFDIAERARAMRRVSLKEN
jgi:hypothetical protein